MGASPGGWRAKRILHRGTRRDGDPRGGLEGETPLPITPRGPNRAGGREGLQGWDVPRNTSVQPGVMGRRAAERLVRGWLWVN